jgi:hypothetical protein
MEASSFPTKVFQQPAPDHGAVVVTAIIVGDELDDSATAINRVFIS